VRPAKKGARPMRVRRKGSTEAIFRLPTFISLFSLIVSGVKLILPVGTRRISATIKCESSWMMVPGNKMSVVNWTAQNFERVIKQNRR